MTTYLSSKKRSHGLMLIEIIVGLAFTGIIIISLTHLFINAIDTYSYSNHYTQAIYLAERKIDETSLQTLSVLSIETTNTELINGFSYKWSREIRPVDLSSSIYQIQITVQWNESNGTHQSKLLIQKDFNDDNK